MKAFVAIPIHRYPFSKNLISKYIPSLVTEFIRKKKLHQKCFQNKFYLPWDASGTCGLVSAGLLGVAKGVEGPLTKT